MGKSRKNVASDEVHDISEDEQLVQELVETISEYPMPLKEIRLKKIFFQGRYWNLEKLTEEELAFLKSFPEEQLGVRL